MISYFVHQYKYSEKTFDLYYTYIIVFLQTSCFPEDDSKYYLIERITELIFDDPACWGKFKDIPLEALLTLDPFKVADFLTDSELLGYL